MARAPSAARPPLSPLCAPAAAPERHSGELAAHPRASARHRVRWHLRRRPRVQHSGGRVVREGIDRHDSLSGIRNRGNGTHGIYFSTDSTSGDTYRTSNTYEELQQIETLTFRSVFTHRKI